MNTHKKSDNYTAFSLSIQKCYITLPLTTKLINSLFTFFPEVLHHIATHNKSDKQPFHFLYRNIATHNKVAYRMKKRFCNFKQIYMSVPHSLNISAGRCPSKKMAEGMPVVRYLHDVTYVLYVLPAKEKSKILSIL